MRSYVVVSIADVTQQMIDDCIQTSIVTLRRSTDGSSCILKFDGVVPSSLTPYTVIDEATILAQVQGASWNSGD